MHPIELHSRKHTTRQLCDVFVALNYQSYWVKILGHKSVRKVTSCGIFSSTFTQNKGVLRHVITMVTDLPHEIEAECELVH